MSVRHNGVNEDPEICVQQSRARVTRRWKDGRMEDGNPAKLTVGTGRVGADVTGREGAETASHAVRVGLGGLDGGGSSDKSSDGVSELHGGLLSDGGRKGLVRRARKQGVTGGKERRGHEAGTDDMRLSEHGSESESWTYGCTALYSATARL